MAIKFIRVAILIVIYIATIFSTCKKGIRFDCAENKYNFKGSIKAYPDLDSINVNDTVWIESRFSTQLTDKMSNELIDYSMAENLGTALGLVRFTGGDVYNPGVIAAANEFDYFVIWGSFNPDDLTPEQDRDYRFEEINNEYKFKIGIIPKKKGKFALGISNPTNVYRKSDKCTKASFNIEIANTDQHFYLLEQNRPGYIISDFERTHLYCFKVK